MKTTVKKFAEFITKEQELNGGHQTIYMFPNGHGASVIHGGYIARGLELAVLGPNGGLDYSTPITDDVIGWMTDPELEKTLGSIKEL